MTSQNKVSEQKNKWMLIMKANLASDKFLQNEFCKPLAKSGLSIKERARVYNKLWLMILPRKVGDRINTLSDKNNSRHKKNGIDNVDFITELKV